MFSVTSGYWKFPGQKTHWFLALASQRFLLCLTAPAFHFSVHSSDMCDASNFLYGLFLVLLYFLFVGHSHHCLPLSSSGVKLCFTCIPGLQSQWIAMIEYRDDVSKHKGPWSWWQVYTWGLDCLLIGWSYQNKFALVVSKFKFQPGEPRSHASPPEHLGQPLPSLFKPGSTGWLHSKKGGTFSTLLSQLPLLSP